MVTAAESLMALTHCPVDTLNRRRPTLTADAHADLADT
jgi:hypothetical protein